VTAHRFSAFSFVDRITSIGESGNIQGSFRIPAHLDRFPQSLVAEAIGQLAAWYAMSHGGFAGRPVAALAGQTRYFSDGLPGELLSLEARIDSCDSDSVSYSGSARVGERLVLELRDCSGAMLPQEQFDDPSCLEQHFQLLKTTGARENRLIQVPSVMPTQPIADAGGIVESDLIIPDQADFFEDHFPKKPVFPATLLMNALSSMVMEQIDRLYSGLEFPRPSLCAIRRVKVRSWIAPGDRVRLRAEGLVAESVPREIKLSARVGDKLVASALADLATEAVVLEGTR
jgi:3-hydroxymyristoyl/3-hydroxydecanoyl-(acyl carrier protein) dehydratase